jgi:hypothetical protein
MLDLKEEVVNRNHFSKMVEDYIQEKPMPYMDAILACAEKCGIEPEMVSRLVSPTIKDKLEAEATDLRLLKTGSQLPL